jgi:excisionase family DNA binding protein
VSESIFLTVLQWVDLTSIGRDTTYELIREGRIRSVKVGRRILIPRSELAAFVDREAS